MTFEVFLYIVLGSYVTMVCILLYGLTRKQITSLEKTSSFISIIVAARNEEGVIAKCLESVANQTYPLSKYEIIVADDGSIDNTEVICQSFMNRYAHIKVIKVLEKKDSLRGKANALAQGIDHAKGDIILITDADCTVPPTWVEETAKRYSDNVGLVGGCTLQKASKPFEGMQSLDWAFLLGLASSVAGLGKPLGSIGNNLSFRKTAYDECGGYRNLKFSVTEDYTVVQAIVGSQKWKYCYPLEPKHLVESQACQDLKTLIRQKHRWGKGGLDMKISGFLIMVIGFLMHLSPIIMLYWGDVVVASSVMMVKFVFDYIFLYQVLRRLQRTDELKWFYWFEVYYIIYVILLPFVVFFGGKVKWKGREF